jgi:hypothetical protein
MRINLALAIMLSGCSLFTSGDAKMFEKDQRLWITRAEPGGGPILYRCADGTKDGDRPQPICVKAFYDEKWRPNMATACDSERRILEEKRRIMLERQDQTSEDNMTAAERALNECLHR